MLRQVPSERINGLPDPGQGLDDAMVLERRNRFGTNNIVENRTGEWRELIRDTLNDPMLWFLIFTSTVFAAIGDAREALILAIAIVPLAGMDIFLHRRTQATTASLGVRLATEACVIRNGRSIIIPVREVVSGDIILVKSGEPFPADGIIIDADEVQVDESVLSGEAYPVRKQSCSSTEWPAAQTDNGGAAVDAAHWGFAGTRLLTGSLRMRAIFTGSDTYYGEIVHSALQGRHSKTPLQIAITNLVKVLLVIALGLCLMVAVVRWFQGFGLLDAVISAMTLAVAALPEEYPVVFTFFLGVGVYRLAKNGALVRRAVAVENIGRITIICSDKTGTLTEGRLTLTHIHPVPGRSNQELLQVARLCSRQDSGDPLDHAIINASPEQIPPGRRLVTFPFTEDRKRETSILQQPGGTLLASVKGAPEVILSQCAMNDDDRKHNLGLAEQLAGEGHKVIACAQKEINNSEDTDHEPQTGFEFVGLLAFEDPIRPGVTDSLQYCRQAGIHVIMITGDHAMTARAVAKETGLGGGDPNVLTAEELDAKIRRGGRVDFSAIDVIARSVPAQKLHIVRKLQDSGEIVCVTGDGVNDVPALQAADVGIAMGERGTRAAREVSAIVLLDDNFRTIVRAIAEGIQLFHNLRMSFAYLLLIHIPLVVSASAIPLMGYPLLYLPIHIVWLELIIHPAALLVYQHLPGAGTMTAEKYHSNVWFFSRREWAVIYLAGLLMTCIIVSGYIYSLGLGHNIEHARATALAILCLYSAFLTAALSRLRTATSYLIGAGTIVSALVLIQTPLSAVMLHLHPLHLNDWLMAIAGSGLIALFCFFSFAHFRKR